MASDVSIAIRIEAAIHNMQAGMLEIADLVGVQPVDIPRHARGGERMLEAVQLEAMVNWLDSLRLALAPSPLSTEDDTKESTPAEADEPDTTIAPRKRGRPAKG